MTRLPSRRSAHQLSSLPPLLRPAALILMAGFAASILAVPVLAGKESKVDGVLHVKNGATPDKGSQTLQLEEIWRAGGEDDEVFFGVVTQAEVDEAANIYLLDTQLSEVKVYSPDGEHLRTLSREGDGPGEVRQPSDMVFIDPKTVGLVQTFPGKLVKLDLEGNPSGVITIGAADPTQGGFFVLLDADQGGGNLSLAGIEITQGETQGIQVRKSFLARYTPEGDETVRYLEKTNTLDFSNFEIIERDQYFVYPRRWSVGPDGRVVAGVERDQYLLNVYAPDGKLDRVIEREFTQRKRTERENKQIAAVIEAQTRQVPFEVKSTIDENQPVIGNIRIGPDGSIWVSHSNSSENLPEGILHVFDVFDSKGNYQREVKIAWPGDPHQDGIFLLGDDRALVVKNLVDALFTMQGASVETEEEAAPIEVIYCKIKT